MLSPYIIAYGQILSHMKQSVFIAACLYIAFGVFGDNASTNPIPILNDDIIINKNTETILTENSNVQDQKNKIVPHVDQYVMQNPEKFKQCLQLMQNNGYKIQYHSCCGCCSDKYLTNVSFSKGDIKSLHLHDYATSRFEYKDNSLILGTSTSGTPQGNTIEQLDYFFCQLKEEDKNASLV